MLRLVTLGRLELQRAGTPPESVVLQPKRLALLTYLALATRGGYQRRDALLALFWPERSHSEARHALRQAVYHLRNALGDGVLESRGSEEVRLSTRVRCDAQEFGDAIRAGRASEAMALYDGDFFAGVFVADASPDWEEWVSRTRARLRAGAAAAAWTVAELAIRSGDVATGLAVAHRAHELDPDDESGLQRLMQWLDRFGRRASALQEFNDFARRMREEYHAEPSASTTALIAAFRQPATSPLGNGVPAGSRPAWLSRYREPSSWRLRTAARRRYAPGKLPTAAPTVQIADSGPMSDIESPR